jgi:large subunit ribosomal protein L25
MELTVECLKRPEGSKPNALRRAGRLPANLYGHKGIESISLTLDAKVAERLLRKASVNNTLIDLHITDIPWRGKTLLREIQSHPAKGTLYHLSFFAVAGHGDADVKVPLHFVGDAVGVKQDGGMLDTVITVLPLRCPPDKIPEAIEVNVSNLHIGEGLHVEQLNLPEGAHYLGEPGDVVVTVLHSKVRGDGETESVTQEG